MNSSEVTISRNVVIQMTLEILQNRSGTSFVYSSPYLSYLTHSHELERVGIEPKMFGFAYANTLCKTAATH